MSKQDERAVPPSVKYVLCPGEVTARNGGVYYIPAKDLARLYGVNFHECIVFNRSDPKSFYGFRDQPHYRYLAPRADGKYDLPKEDDLT